jgi:hypothetical protein
MKTNGWLLLFGLILSTNCFARPEGVRLPNEMSGEEFISLCSSKILEAKEQQRDDTQIAFCTGFVKGVIHSHDSLAVLSEQPHERLFCLPKGRTDLELTAVVVSYMEAEPRALGSYLGNLVLAGLHNSFPCKN